MSSRPQDRNTPAATDFVGPSGNSTDKYESGNPVTRFLLDRFLAEIDASLRAAGPESILDVGCGEGVVTERMAALTSAATTGVDLGDERLREQWAARERPGLTFRPASAYDLPFADRTFDCVCAIEVLEHLERPRDALAELTRVARRTLIVSVPREPLWRVVHLLAGRDVRSLGNTPGHLNHWSAGGFERLVAEFARVTTLRTRFPWTIVVATRRDVAPTASAEAPQRRRIRSKHSSGSSLRVLYYGTYEAGYPRNAQVVSSLRRAGIDVIEWHVPVWDYNEHKFGIGLRAAAKLAPAELRLVKRPSAGFDAIIVGYPGHFDMPLARRAAGNRPVVFNPLVSLEDTLVNDRGILKSGSLKARGLRVVDRQAFRTADLVVADTRQHAEYFGDRFGLAPQRIAVCYVGAEDRLFTPRARPNGSFDVLFVGKLIPLHGLETIIAAAGLCPDLAFRIVGDGQLARLLATRPANIRWTPWVGYERLPALYRESGCALGIFGTTEKAHRVIPNKAFHALATATPLITSDTPATRELLEDGRDALLVPPGDVEALAGAIRRLARDSGLRAALAARGRATYEREASEVVLGPRWRRLLEALVDGR